MLRTTIFAAKNFHVMTNTLTENKDPKARKAKIARPSNRNIDSSEIQSALAMNGEVEELYEVKENPKKEHFYLVFFSKK